VPDEIVPVAKGPTRAAPPEPSMQWGVPSKAAPETPRPRISVRRWLGAAVVGFIVWLAADLAMILILQMGNVAGVIGLALGIWVTGRIAGAAGWRQWLLAGVVTLGAAAAISGLLILISLPFRP
jgi:hypothetical protein